MYFSLVLSTICYLKVLSADGTHCVGKILKQWSGPVKEYFTDADNFGIQCEMRDFVSLYQLPYFVVPMDLDVKMKAVVLGACFLIVSIAKTVYNIAILYCLIFS